MISLNFLLLPLNNNTNTIDLVSINSSIPFIFTFSYNSPLVSNFFLFLLSSSFKLRIIKVIGILKTLAKIRTLPIIVHPLALTLIVFQDKTL